MFNRIYSARLLLALALAVVAMTVTACKETDAVDSAQSRVEQAQQQLASAKAELAAAQAQDASSQADAGTQDAGPDPSATTAESAQPDNESNREPSNESAASESLQEHAPTQVCADCGTISAIDVVRTGNGPPEYVGSIVGGAVGAAIGNQIGGGSGKTIATIVGAVGGALAGHETQQRMAGPRAYRVGIHMDAGGSRTITVPDVSQIAQGMRVHVRGNNIVLMGD